MPGKRTLNATNLRALGADTLAGLLMELSKGNATVQRRLRLALAEADGVEGAAQEVRKRLAAIARATTFVDSRKREALMSDLRAQHGAISGPIAAADPALALELLWRFLELANGVMQRCSDTTGTVIGVFRDAVNDLGPIATAAGADRQALVEQVADLLQDDDFGQFEQLIPAMAETLGTEGLELLEREVRDRGAPAGRFTLLQIAECRGDPDAYLAQFSPQQQEWPAAAADVADHFLAVGRAEEALAVLDRAATNARDLHAPEWDDSRIAVLEALGRGDEAQQLRWSCFEKSLSIPHLRDYLQRLDDFADVEAEERALRVVEAHPHELLALEFLVHWPALPRAARYVLEHRDAWDGEAYEVLAPAAERLSGGHPVAATLLLRSMVVFALWAGRSKRYRHAAEHLRSCELLAAAIEDWQGLENHETFAGRLRESFATKRGFWTLVER